MDPNIGHDLRDTADLMVSPDLGGTQLESEKPIEEPVAEVEEAPEVEETKQEPQEPETEETPDDEGDEPLAAEAPQGENDDEPDDTPDDSGTRSFTVKVDGKEQEVTLEELQRGYSGQKFVQKGMMEAAEARKQAEEVYNNLQAERQQVQQVLNMAQQGISPPPAEPDKALFQTDPLAYMEAKIAYDEQLEQYNGQMAQVQQVAGQQSAADQQAMQTYLTGELKQLQAIDPDFREPEKANKVKEQMLAKGNELYGYTPEEIGQIVDHRAIRVLRDAMRYHEIVQGKEQAQEKPKPKNVKGKPSKRPSTAQSRRRRQKDNFKKSGDIQDAVDLLFQ